MELYLQSSLQCTLCTVEWVGAKKSRG